MSRRILAGSLLSIAAAFLAIGQGQVTAPAAAFKVTDSDMQKLVFFAVLEGLYSDGVDNVAVDIILGVDPKTKLPRMEENFVYACPLCLPAYDAFVLYRSRVPFYGRKSGGDTFGPGLDGIVLTKLKSTKKADRLEAIRMLVDRWVNRRLELMRLSAEERKAWTTQIEAGRQQGMKVLQGDSRKADWKGCAFCDGAAGGCEVRK
jgi:hypothetical protein